MKMYDTLLAMARSYFRFAHRHCNFFSLFWGTFFFLAALTPSLVPRPWYLQGLVCGLALAIGYAFGVLLSWLYRIIVRGRTPPWLRITGWAFVLSWLPIVGCFELVQSVYRQQELRQQVVGGEPVTVLQYIGLMGGILAVTILVAVLFILVAKVIRWGVIRLHHTIVGRKSIQKISHPLLRVTVSMLIIVLLFSFANNTVAHYLRDTANTIFKAQNSAMSDKYKQPTNSLLSGSDASLISWEALGGPGRQFVSAAPTLQDIQSFDQSKKAIQPIRTYVGIDLSTNIREQARLAVKELERTGAFDRKAIQVVVTTGSGGIDLPGTRSLEYILAGDVATVAIQYSYFPSWLSLLTDRERAKDSARELTLQVKHELSKQTPNKQPKLYLFGESLGSYGIEAAFGSTDELFKVADGTLLVGPPGFNPLHNQLVDHRDKGSPAYLPVYEQGKNVIFYAPVHGLPRSTTAPKLVYVQNPTDPVTKWGPDILWHEPGWDREQIDRGQSRFEWHPIVSFLQITIDMVLSLNVPEGYGHNYGTVTASAWTGIVQPVDWTEAKTHELQERLLDVKKTEEN